MTDGPPAAGPAADDGSTVRLARRRLAVDGLGIAAIGIGFGLVFGLAAREAGYSLVEAVAMSTIVFAGAAQLAAAGLVAAGAGWPLIVLLTAFLNARHLLYAAALAPWLREQSRPRRAAMAHVLTDEAFALTLVHFRRLGRADPGGYAIAAVAVMFIPWNAATIAGFLAGEAVPDPRVIALDIIFPAAMAGLAVGLVSGRRELVAAVTGALVAVVVGLAIDPSVGIIAGGLAGPFAGLAVPRRDPAVPEPDELPADPATFAAVPGRSDDGMAP
ncbi:MAG: branched-chain amino acid transporter permease [Chloroflexi bacterium]|nr:branched-chain amino acid transporter permease [Chloroflexota bacterium]